MGGEQQGRAGVGTVFGDRSSCFGDEGISKARMVVVRPDLVDLRNLGSRRRWATVSRAALRFSRYWRQPEYEEYAELKTASARVTPSSVICSTTSGRYGSQLRLPQ